jgi:predicted phage baseplate assembly protein
VANETAGAPDDCGCCEGVSARTPLQIANRPGLSAIAYRIGTHSTFKQSLLAGLSGAPAPMRDLTTRDDDDFTIALLDAWATAGDVLTFYQERVANESYLRTATERLSVTELARLIGYRPSPGVAAAVALAFTVDGNPGSPLVAQIPAGTKVQSIPGPGETPQTFETVQAAEARAEWNALKLKTTVPQVLASGSTTAWLSGAGLNLNVGDVLLFVGQEREQATTSTRWETRRVTQVTADAVNNRTLVAWAEPLAAVNPTGQPVQPLKVYALRKRAALFGYNAPDPTLLPAAIQGQYPAGTIANNEWVFTIDTANRILFLDTTYPAVLNGSWVVLAVTGFQQLYGVQSASEAALNRYALTGKSTRVQVDSSQSLSTFAGANYRGTVVFAQSEELTLLAERPLAAQAATGLTATLTLASQITNLPKGRRLIVEGRPAARFVIGTATSAGTHSGAGAVIAEEVTVDSCALAGNSTQIKLARGLANSYVLNSVTVYANVASATHGETVTEVLGSGDGAATYQQFALKQAPLTYVSDATAEGGAASTLQVRVNDVLWQEAPSLYVRGPGERVYVTRSQDASNTGQPDSTAVQFGDGVNGARLPTGQLNVRATYRTGTGTAGNLTAGQLNILLSRPLGVTGAVNPLAPSGGADAENLDDARGNAPLTVLTLDRVVSLQDYADFARAFAGIKKALATWTWNGQRRGVFLTVAGPNGAAIPANGDTCINLLAALRDRGDPFVALDLKTYRQATFTLTARVKVDAAYLGEKVRAAVKQALLDEFSFDQRGFGQPVALSEVYAVMQNVEGVAAVDVNALQRGDGEGGSGLQKPLPVALPALGTAEVLAAELLTIDPAGINLSPL